LSHNDAELIISSRNLKELERVKSRCKDPKKITILALDMSKPHEVIEQSKIFLDKLES